MWVFTVFIFFEVCERAKFSKSCNLIDGLFPSPSPWAGEGSNAHAWFRPEQMQRRLTDGGGGGGGGGGVFFASGGGGGGGGGGGAGCFFTILTQLCLIQAFLNLKANFFFQIIQNVKDYHEN